MVSSNVLLILMILYTDRFSKVKLYIPRHFFLKYFNLSLPLKYFVFSMQALF